jgi:hypothetical protein
MASSPASTFAETSCRSRLPLLPERISAARATGTSWLRADTCTRFLRWQAQVEGRCIMMVHSEQSSAYRPA